MTEDEKHDAVQDIIENITDDTYAYTKFLHLFSLCRINTRQLAKAAIEKHVYWPAELYTDASPGVRDELIAKLKATTNPHEAGHIQCCLAMIGDDKVLEVFHHLEHNPLPWRQKLCVNPSKYAEAGGWSFTETGEKYKLTFDTCYYLTDNPNDEEPVDIGTLTTEDCENCGCAIVELLSIDGHDERVSFLGIDGKMTAALCPNCVSITEVTFCRYELDGSSTRFLVENPQAENYLSDEDLQKMHTKRFGLAKQPVNPFFGTVNEIHNTIGGHANWVQDWEHYNCPSCAKKMVYVAQIHWHTIIDSMEGTLFFEICTECKIIACFHQQT